uniref:Uncharacterized protein n=1 Tax=Glossina austeni TaxID=7395 RepID=A0A1A9UUH6_GLOAU
MELSKLNCTKKPLRYDTVCGCQKCKRQRSETDAQRKKWRKPSSPFLAKSDSSLKMTFSLKKPRAPDLFISTTDASLWNLFNVFFDVIAGLAYFLMITAVFFILASVYFKKVLLDFFYATRKTQTLVLLIIAVIMLSFWIQLAVTKMGRAPQPAKLSKKIAVESKPNTIKTTTRHLSTETGGGSSVHPKSTVTLTTKKKSEKTQTEKVMFSPLKLFTKTSTFKSPAVAVPKVQSLAAKSTQTPNFKKKAPELTRNGNNNKLIFNPFKVKPHPKTRGTWSENNANTCTQQRNAFGIDTLCKAVKAANLADQEDEEGLEIFKTYKKHSYALDMKTPPAILVYLRNYISERVCMNLKDRCKTSEIIPNK